MPTFDPAATSVIKPTRLLRERVVVADWMSVSSSVTQREFAEELRNHNKWMDKCGSRDSLFQAYDFSSGRIVSFDGRHDCSRVSGVQTNAGEVSGTAGCDICDDSLEGCVAARALGTQSAQPAVDCGDDGSGGV